MAIQVSLNHKTEYRYDRPVVLSPHVVRLRPAPHCRTPIKAYSLKIQPTKHFINWQQDPFGNYLARLVFPEKTRKLSLEVDVVAELTVINPFDFFVEDYARSYPFSYPELLRKDLQPYLEIREKGPALRAWVEGLPKQHELTVDFLVEVNNQACRQVQYIVRMEPGVQTCEETLELGKGSCRDSAWLLVQALRQVGFAARFVSGYLVQLRPDQEALDGPSGATQDFTDLHAWAEVYLPGAGWLGLDATSGLFAGEGHIPLACTPEPQSAAPVDGLASPCKTDFYYHNQVRRVHEDPRVTAPYSESQWSRILKLGDDVDARLLEHDVRLTQGGEPTFVAIENTEAPEWNTAALGEHKNERAEVLTRRVQNRVGSGTLLHHGQGKWYPGEPLPRWANSIYWRRDGIALWSNPGLQADPRHDYGHGESEARHLMRAICKRLGVTPHNIMTAYEDVYYYVWKEQTLPANVDPFDIDLDDPLERKRLAKVLEQGLKNAVGYVLAIEKSTAGDAWLSHRWSHRRARLYLVPGDSPLGYRLPLDTLQWEPDNQRQQIVAIDPFEQRVELANFAEVVTRRGQVPGARATPERAAPTRIIRTALCVEPRNGCLRVFMPPCERLEDFVEVISAIESAAGELSLPVVIEGYNPPHDSRLQMTQITPDPGVIEVNVAPCATWRDLVDSTQTLYEEARLARLTTEKFMLDGRHTGTGGGNHVTLGGATPADSPFLRRPELLSSLVLYWQHHPSLSYLFSGLFIGPTSQAPRIDEARNDSLKELEIALGQLPQGEVATPWLVDRLFRNILVDVTGNTHRAEFCIDKLYSPDSAVGRRGLLEFRAFEMPPHAEMSALQMLLLRALVVKFWVAPYRRSPIRWGNALHDRFLLPYFVWEDFAEVIADLRAANLNFELDWFRPFFEFRFPVFGRVSNAAVQLELRLAIEPWHVLGEETGLHGTSRFVDSSLERLQIRASGMSSGRYVIACNGRRMPLRETSTVAECVAGVRFKAWQPSSGLHPTIPVHGPLVFDVIDTWNGTAVAGCTYHVGHPGGRNYDVFPVNAGEAEARRLARFEPFGHTPGPIELPVEESNQDHPFTLDLRYPPRP